MLMGWYRRYSGTVADPKFTVIARRANQPRIAVLAVWDYLLELAEENRADGDVSNLSTEEVAVVLEIEEAAVQAIINVMQDRGMIADLCLTAWRSRNPSSDSSTDRVRAFRERKKAKAASDAAAQSRCGNGDETDGNAGNTLDRLDKTDSTDSSANADSSASADLPAPNGVGSRDVPSEMVAVWNHELGDLLPKPRKLDQTRKAKLARRLKEDFRDDIVGWRDYCQRIRGSPHLIGENDRGWKADLDWCLEPRNVNRILEGRYDRKSAQQSITYAERLAAEHKRRFG